MDKSFSGGYKSTHWMNPEKYNITFPFEELGFITDTGAFSNMYFYIFLIFISYPTGAQRNPNLVYPLQLQTYK